MFMLKQWAIELTWRSPNLSHAPELDSPCMLLGQWVLEKAYFQLLDAVSRNLRPRFRSSLTTWFGAFRREPPAKGFMARARGVNCSKLTFAV